MREASSSQLRFFFAPQLLAYFTNPRDPQARPPPALTASPPSLSRPLRPHSHDLPAPALTTCPPSLSRPLRPRTHGLSASTEMPSAHPPQPRPTPSHLAGSLSARGLWKTRVAWRACCAQDYLLSSKPLPSHRQDEESARLAGHPQVRVRVRARVRDQG